MATIVFDIEISALPLENYDEAQQDYLFREAEIAFCFPASRRYH
jgi:hypothetical protein